MLNNKYLNEVLANLYASLDAIESNVEDILMKVEKGIKSLEIFSVFPIPQSV